MKLLYHGTHTGSGIRIARAGAILSPWYKEIENLKKLFEGKEGRFQELYSGKTIEEQAFDDACDLYEQHEIEHRVKSVSVSRFLYGPYGINNYGMRWENCGGGGLVLAVEVTPEISKILPSNWEQRLAIYVPGKLEIKSLREVHLSPRCIKDAEQIVKREFEKYNPKYLELR